MRVFLPGGFLHENRGDAALLEGLLDLLHTRWPEVNATLTSFNPVADGDIYGAHVLPMIVPPGSVIQRAMGKAVSILPVLAPLQSIVHVVTLIATVGYLQIWASILPRHPRIARILAWSSLWSNAQEILQADRVIAVPGGYLNAYRWTDTYWMYHLPVIYLADYLNKPVDLSPCTVGPFSGINRATARLSLRHVNQIFLREGLSLDMLRDLAVPLRHQPIVTFDVAFVHARGYLTQPEAAVSPSHILGVSVRQHNFPGSTSIAQARRQYLNAHVDAIQRLLDYDPLANVVITAQTKEDEAISYRLEKMIGSPRVELRLDLDTPDQLLGHYQHMRLLLGTRMHANILAMCVDTPVVAVSYDPKTRGVMRSLGLEDRVLEIDDLSTLSHRLIGYWNTAPMDRQFVHTRVKRAREMLISAIEVM